MEALRASGRNSNISLSVVGNRLVFQMKALKFRRCFLMFFPTLECLLALCGYCVGKIWGLVLRATAWQPRRQAEVWQRGFGKRARNGSIERFAPGGG